MSWSMQWPVQTLPSPQPPLPSTIIPAPPPPAPDGSAPAPPNTSMPPPMSPYGSYNQYQLTPEQQYFMQQQSWQQWQQYQQQYAQWQAQYGEQYARQQQQQTSARPPLQSQPQFPNITAPPPPPPTAGPPPMQKMPIPPFTGHQKPPLPQQKQSYNYDIKSAESNSNFRKNWQSDPNNGKNITRNQRNQGQFGIPPARYVDESPQKSASKPIDEKSAEEIAFDEQFRKWEEQFDTWKKENANHPDREAYYEYENKMQECRKKLLQRRAQMRERRMEATETLSNETSPADFSTVENIDHRDSGVGEQPKESVYPSNAFEPIPGLDLVNNNDSGKRNFRNNKRKRWSQPDDNNLPDNGNNNPQNIRPTPKRPKDNNMPEENVDGEDDKQPRNLPFGFRDFFERLKDDNSAPADRDYGDAGNANRSTQNPFNRFNDNNQQRQQNQAQTNQQLQTNQQSPQQQPFNSGFYPNRQSNFQNISPAAGKPALRSLMDIDVPIFNDNDFKQNRFSNPFTNDNNSNRSELNSSPIINEEPDEIAVLHDQRSNSPVCDSSINTNTDIIKSTKVETSESVKLTDRYDSYNAIRSQMHARPSLAVHLLKTYVPVKITEYNHIPQRFHKWHAEQVIDYAHSSRKNTYEDHRDRWTKKENRGSSPQEINSNKFTSNRQHNIRGNQRIDGWNDERNDGRNDRRNNSGRFNDRRENKWNKDNLSDIGNSKSESNPNNQNQPSNTQENNKEKSKLVPIENKFSDAGDKPPVKKVVNELVIRRPSKEPRQNVIDIDTVLCHPGRETRPQKLVFLLRGLPGSGKSHLAKLIKNKETEIGGTGKVRILSIDDYFTSEADVDADKSTKNDGAGYLAYDAKKEETYMACILKLFRSTIIGGMYDFIIVDCNNVTLQYYTEFYNFATLYKFTPYTCELDLDVQKCIKSNIHNRSAADIEKAYHDWKEAPAHYIQVDFSSLLKEPEPDSHCENVSNDSEIIDDVADNTNSSTQDQLGEDISDDDNLTEMDSTDEHGFLTSKWDNDTSEQKLARLDGTNKPMRHTIEDYLQLDGWEPPPASSNGKKRVRWADIEEKREQEKQRAIGFVVGQTNWDNIMGNTDGSKALNKIKYI